MLGYLDPVSDTGDTSQYVYYSNVRVVQLVTAPSSATVSPSTLSALWGSNPTFTVSASGTTPFTYQWKKGGVNIDGATNATLTITNVTSAAAGSYTVGVTNSAGGTVSSAGVLSVVVPAPTFLPGTMSFAGGNVVMHFSSTNPNDTATAFTLQSSPVVEGPYTNTSATFTLLGDGTFEVSVPQGEGNMFYRLVHSN
jgi:hypothetical protein